MKEILFGSDAREKIKKGIDTCVDVVKVSLGGNGRNVAIYNGYSTDIINDGVSIAKQIKVKDEVEMAGIQLAKQCAEMTNNSAGDGTTTTLVLLQSILNEIINPINTVNPRELRDSLFSEANKVLDKIKVRQISGREDVFNLAFTSSLNKDIAELVADIFEELGKEAKITIEEKSYECLKKETGTGIKIDSRKASILRTEGREVYENIPVMMLEGQDVIQKRVDEAIKSGGNTMVLISKEFDRKLLADIESVQGFKFIPVESKENLKDLKLYCGTENVDKVIVDDESCTVIGGKGDVKYLVEELEVKLKGAVSRFEHENISNRIADLRGSVAIIEIGKQSDVEREEYVLKIEDAVGTIKGAYELGYCSGAGISLRDAGKSSELLAKICSSPHDQLIANGWDGKANDGVIDSFKAVKESLLNAISVATSVLMVEAALIEKEDES